ncbi:MAG: DUF58 domain-containing protein [Planctomycetota bacterium]
MDRATAIALAARFTLRFPTRTARGLTGERLGGGVGSSLEFQDYRAYAPGDDVRHIDWSAWGRRDELVVRLHREEITPIVEVLLDSSASMGSSDAKRELARGLATFARELARRDRMRCRVWTVGERLERFDREDELDARLASWTPEGRAGFEALALRPPRLSSRSLRILISDLLFRAEPESVLRPLARDAARCVAIQVLDRHEDDPDFAGGTRLVDVESAVAMDLVVNDEARRQYRRRLLALREGWAEALRRAGGALAVARGDEDPLAIAGGPLRRAGLLGLRGAREGAS